MAELLSLPTFSDERGCLTVLDRDLPFTVRRTYYVYNVTEGAVRAGHRHHHNRQILICIQGRCKVYVNDDANEQTFDLHDRSVALLLEPSDWHLMSAFSVDAILLVLASEPYDVADYVDAPYL